MTHYLLRSIIQFGIQTVSYLSKRKDKFLSNEILLAFQESIQFKS